MGEFETNGLMHESDKFLLNNSESTVGDNTKPARRPSNDEQQEKARGLEMINHLCNQINDVGLSRPGINAMTGGRDRHNRTINNQ